MKMTLMKTEFGNVKLQESTGYLHVTSKKEGNHHKKLHRLIWEKHYRKPVPKGYVIHHIDRNPVNNQINNLQCVEERLHTQYHNRLKNFKQYGYRRPSEETKLRMSKHQNTSGYFRVVIRTRGNTDYYEYHYYENGKRKSITRKSIKLLKEEVLKRNLKWIEY